MIWWWCDDVMTMTLMMIIGAVICWEFYWLLRPNNCHSASEMCGRQDVMGNLHYCRHSCHNPCHRGHRNHQHTLKNSIFDLEHSNIFHICHTVLGPRCRLFAKKRELQHFNMCRNTVFIIVICHLFTFQRTYYHFLHQDHHNVSPVQAINVKQDQ